MIVMVVMMMMMKMNLLTNGQDFVSAFLVSMNLD